jgi:hypothetical protein
VGYRVGGPVLPMRVGDAEKRTHDYKRHGTTTLFAALEIATGHVTGAVKPKQRRQELFLAFLRQLDRAHPDVELHLVMDNYATHKTPEVMVLAAVAPEVPSALHPDVGVVTESRRGLVRDHRQAGHPPWHLHQRERPQREDPAIHHRLERPQTPLRLDHHAGTDPRESQPSTNFRNATLGGVS